jgi:hypothetical protein
MSGRRWADMSLEQRYAALHNPRPVAEPAAKVSLASSVRGATFSADEIEQQAANGRRAKAMLEIENALGAEREAKAQERRSAVDRVIHDTALGRFAATGGLR